MFGAKLQTNKFINFQVETRFGAQTSSLSSCCFFLEADWFPLLRCWGTDTC
jgi:hypothetical protein